MNLEMFNNEPLSDSELFVLLRESFSDDKSTWDTVKEAQAVFKEFRRRSILKEIEDEKLELLTINQINHAA
jgi:hypothetical protein